MTNDEKLMQQALDALEEARYIDQNQKVIEALRARLAQPEPEPVAWYYAGSDVESPSVALDANLDDAQKANCTPLYTAPPQREWQGLTMDEQQQTWHEQPNDLFFFARAIEAKLKEKNAT